MKKEMNKGKWQTQGQIPLTKNEQQILDSELLFKIATLPNDFSQNLSYSRFCILFSIANFIHILYIQEFMQMVQTLRRYAHPLPLASILNPSRVSQLVFFYCRV